MKLLAAAIRAKDEKKNLKKKRKEKALHVSFARGTRSANTSRWLATSRHFLTSAPTSIVTSVSGQVLSSTWRAQHQSGYKIWSRVNDPCWALKSDPPPHRNTRASASPQFIKVLNTVLLKKKRGGDKCVIYMYQVNRLINQAVQSNSNIARALTNESLLHFIIGRLLVTSFPVWEGF